MQPKSPKRKGGTFVEPEATMSTEHLGADLLAKVVGILDTDTRERAERRSKKAKAAPPRDDKPA